MARVARSTGFMLSKPFTSTTGVEAFRGSCNAIQCTWSSLLANGGLFRAAQSRIRRKYQISPCQNPGCCFYSEPVSNQQGNGASHTQRKAKRRQVRVSMDSCMAARSKESKAPMQVSYREVAQAVDMMPSDGLAFLQSAGLRGFGGAEVGQDSVPERRAEAMSGYICGDVSDEDFPDRLTEPPLLKLGNAKVAIGHRPGCRGPAGMLGGVSDDGGAKHSSPFKDANNHVHNGAEQNEVVRAGPGTVDVNVAVTIQALIEKKEGEKLVELLESLNQSGVEVGSVANAKEVIDMLAHGGGTDLALR